METPIEHREEGSSPHGEQCSVTSCSLHVAFKPKLPTAILRSEGEDEELL